MGSGTAEKHEGGFEMTEAERLLMDKTMAETFLKYGEILIKYREIAEGMIKIQEFHNKAIKELAESAHQHILIPKDAPPTAN
jgi:hypothetical protein